MVQTQPSCLPATARVRELIDPDTNWWDIQRLRDNFNSKELRAISSIPISGTGHPDVMVWRGTNSGVFSFRSAYHLAKEIEAGAARNVQGEWREVKYGGYCGSFKCPMLIRTFYGEGVIIFFPHVTIC